VLIKLSQTRNRNHPQNAEKIPNYQLTVSLEKQTVEDGNGFSASFEFDPFRKFCLMEAATTSASRAPRGSARRI